MKTTKTLGSDLLQIGLLKRLTKLHYLQFIFVFPTSAIILLASLSVIYGVRMNTSNFGMVVTWVIWWLLLVGLFAVVGRGWCFICPFGAAGEWLQRLSLWWKRSFGLGYNFKYPRKLQNLWLGIAFFVAFMFMDAGYGISNSPSLTGGLVVVLLLWSILLGLLFERRAFCKYQCPLTVLIGMSSMFAPFEIRRKDEEVCKYCKTKDCFKGNERYYGCPTSLFQGGGIDSNRDCILCTECIKSCPHSNVTMKLRWWGHDLWSRQKSRLDESIAGIVLTGVVTVVSILLVLFLPSINKLFKTVMPAGIPPNDWPRLIGIVFIFFAGIGIALAMVYGFCHLSKRFSGSKEISTRTIFTHFGYAVIPLGVMKFLSDILDHVFRTWGSVGDVFHAMALDFPLNRVMLMDNSVRQLVSTEVTYLIQFILIGIGLGFSIYVAHKLARRMFQDTDVALRAFLPIASCIFILGMTALWALSAAL